MQGQDNSSSHSVRHALQADCTACKGLCCILLPFDADQGFAFDKAAGTPCRHLTPDFRCEIHAELVPRGCPGCHQYDCHGAGQRVSAQLGLGADWHASEVLVNQAYALFAATRAAHARLKAAGSEDESDG